MTTCIDPIILEAWHDGELPPARAAEIIAHVETCPACHAFVERTCAAGDALRTAALVPSPSGSAHRWAATLRIARERRVRRFAGWMTAAAAVVLALTLPVAFSNPADARPVVAAGLTDWEATAVGGGDDVATPTAQARLIAVDLALPDDTTSGGRP